MEFRAHPGTRSTAIGLVRLHRGDEHLIEELVDLGVEPNRARHRETLLVKAAQCLGRAAERGGNRVVYATELEPRKDTGS